MRPLSCVGRLCFAAVLLLATAAEGGESAAYAGEALALGLSQALSRAEYAAGTAEGGSARWAGPHVTVLAEAGAGEQHSCDAPSAGALCGAPGPESSRLPRLRTSSLCSALIEELGSPTMAAGAPTWPPPEQVPAELASAYTFGGSVPVVNWYFAQSYLGGEALRNVWTREELERFVKRTKVMIKSGRPSRISRYGRQETADVGAALKRYVGGVKGKHGLVVGSERPWLEGMLLGYGARQVTTWEYGHIESQHPQVSTMTPPELAERWSAGTLEGFDFAFSFSSLEHSGLGRYGDPLNPYGDIEAVAQVRCLLKPGGLFFLGLPIGADALVWNANRIYGPKRLALLLANFDLIDVVGAYNASVADWRNQPVLVLRADPVTKADAQR
mmetsp:Transcript_17126/g.56026  ORF Transcript_17126/g.56026 Transcript_17126/m.56026 type:complete len:386 (-) Transcript_17126:54-1211(-)